MQTSRTNLATLNRPTIYAHRSHADGPSAAGAPLPLTTIVPRELVHRASVSEVFLTHWETNSPDSFTVKAQWPRGHALFVPSGGYQDPLLLVESVRQAGALLSHAEYGVPFGYQFLMSDMSYSAQAGALAVGPVPTEVELLVDCYDIVRRGTRLAGLRYRVTVMRDGLPLAVAEAAFTCASPSVYERLRGERGTVAPAPSAPIAPALVGRTCSRDVVLSAGDSAWQLRFDTTHPIFFDHPVDHVPGMVLIEAARQAAHAGAGLPHALPVHLTSAFERYVEFDAPCWIEAEAGTPAPDGRVTVEVRGSQNGRTAFTAAVTLQPHH
ncbi:ScbA/BarX family gamma-butyrolactone biosynthesis protein [Streptomyces sp. NPDC099050]|uniref:ScbA/BarX family gamma-butyrolactone biosynthesis protein n=1 Tax=Streptomyces sp. NPDC099050 TaxID=3366100 RepID=UPI003814F59C